MAPGKLDTGAAEKKAGWDLAYPARLKLVTGAGDIASHRGWLPHLLERSG